MKPINILIVEDNIIISNQIKNYLSSLDYNDCCQATSGENALRLFEEKNPDIVLMDIELDGNLDGIDTAFKMQKRKITPIIYLSKIDNKRTLSRVKKTMPAAFLIKPFRNIDIRNAIEIAIYNSRTPQKRSFSFSPLRKTIGEEINNGNHEFNIINDRIYFKNETAGFSRVYINDIVYLESVSYKTIAHTINGKYTIPYNLKTTSSNFKKTPLIRIHRKYVVNIDFIAHLQGNNVILELNTIDKKPNINIDLNNLTTLPISSSCRKELLNKLKFITAF